MQTLVPATEEDAPELAAMRTRVSERLTNEFGPGHWAHAVSEAVARRAHREGRVFVMRDGAQIVGTLRLATKKPWAIDTAYFTRVKKALYLIDMAVAPELQRRGVGRACLAEAARIAREWPVEALRLDAYDAPAGAGEFYARCGYREVGRVSYRGVPLIYYEQLLT